MALQSKWLDVFAFSCWCFLSLFCFGTGYITYTEVVYPLLGERQYPGSPWPLPRSWQRCPVLVTIDPKLFVLTSNAVNCIVMDVALLRYKDIILLEKQAQKDESLKLINTLRVDLEPNYECGYPKLGDDESYNLDVPHGGIASIRAKTVWGALRGLETFSQLLFLNKNGKFSINVTRIEDSPRFKYRGVMLDTGRHFLDVTTIKKNLDAMAYNKFNVFHWHIVDDQSFPFESKSFPNLTTLSAYSSNHVYTQLVIKDIIEYARLRGIRVIPELDSPGHTQAIGRAFYHLLTPCYGKGPDRPYTAKDGKHAAAEMLNPMLNETYTTMKALIKEIQTVFADEYIHLGMDETYHDCWMSNPQIRKFMKEHKYESYGQIEEHYVKRIMKDVRDLGYKYMIWQDPVDNKVEVSLDSVVQIWKRGWNNSISSITKKGYNVVLSACWYLNYMEHGLGWKNRYMCQPTNFDGTEEDKDKVIGGEVCMWGEYVDSTNLMPRLWPSASAVAERLWSPESANDTDSATFRLDEQRCRMLKRRIPTQPILPGFCEGNSILSEDSNQKLNKYNCM